MSTIRSCRAVRNYRIISPVPAPDLKRLRAVVLVPHAVAKCPDCGSTVVTDPLPHRCDPTSGPRAIDYGGCLL